MNTAILKGEYTRSRARGLERVQWSTRCGGHSGDEKRMGWLKGRLIATLLSVLASMHYSME